MNQEPVVVKFVDPSENRKRNTPVNKKNVNKYYFIVFLERCNKNSSSQAKIRFIVQ